MIRIKIKNVDKKDIYINILHHFNISDEWELTTNEVKILGEMCFKLNELIKSGVSYDNANVLVFNKEFKDEVCKNLNTSNNTYANALSKLRKIGLVEDNKVVKQILFNINSKVELLITYEEVIKSQE